MKTTVKTQKRPLRGSLQNSIMGNNSTLPVVGKGATIIRYTDRQVAEVISVTSDGKRAKLEYLEAKRDKTKEGGMGHQNWIFEPSGNFFEIVWKWNSWRVVIEYVDFTEEYKQKCENQNTTYRKLLTEETFKEVYQNEVFPVRVVDGVTEKKIKYSKINILFGQKDYHYDWTF